MLASDLVTVMPALFLILELQMLLLLLLSQPLAVCIHLYIFILQHGLMHSNKKYYTSQKKG